MSHLTMPTRELVGLLADVHPFASDDEEDTTFHRVVVRWDGSRLYTMAGDGHRFAMMSWGPDDGDEPVIPGLDFGSTTTDDFELAILPENAKEIFTKFKLPAKGGEAPLRVSGDMDSLKVSRDAGEVGSAALEAVAMSRPWDNNAPQIDQLIAGVAETVRDRSAVAFMGPALADFCNPKKVRQRGALVMRFGGSSTYIEIGRHFRGAIVNAEIPKDGA